MKRIIPSFLRRQESSSFKPLLFLIFTLLILILSTLSLFAETLALQNFESQTTDTWNYTPNPPPSRLLWWGPTTENMGGAVAYTGTTYWAGWDLDDIECTLTFETISLSVGYTYNLSFYYFTKNLTTANDFCRYSIMYDTGTEWSNWVTVNNNTNAWTAVSVDIPAGSSNLRLCLGSKFNGTTKYAHWDYIKLEKTPIPPSPPAVSNVTFSQRTDGSGQVDIYYDLFDDNGDNSTVSLLLSEDGGANYTFSPAPANLSGDIGAGIINGVGKHIIWNAEAEATSFDNNQYKMRVTAEDNSFPPVNVPTFNPPGSTYVSAQTVTISCTTSGAAIRYTTDGSEPTESSTLYQSQISIAQTTTLKAKAFKTAWTPSATATAVYTINIPMPVNFLLVEGGTFNNGTSDVTLSSFYMDKYELTQSAYQAVMGTNPASGYGVGASYPIYDVSWFNSIEYCNRRSINEGLIPCYSYSTYGTNPANWPEGWDSDYINDTNVSCSWTTNGYRLPSEAEWEFAARGGNSTHNYTYSGSNDLNAVAWYSSNSNSTTHTVGTKTANELGLYDMSGNVWEWNWDIYGDYPGDAQTNPHGAASGSYRVPRGGSWIDVAYFCTVSVRNTGDATISNVISGFRCVRITP